jgi:tRNA (cmo5U34)-methyltransferase
MSARCAMKLWPEDQGLTIGDPRAGRAGRSTTPEVSVSAQFHWNPDTYLEEIRADVPRYDELQERTIDAIPFAPERVLELGVGTGETTRRLLERYPDAEVIALDSTPEMVFQAREMGIEVRLARMEDPLPDGPWDLVVSVLSVHHLEADGKRDLFRRVREQSRALVLGDVVDAEVQIASLEPGVDFPDRAEDVARWCDGEVVWAADDLAVISATYE